MKLPEIIEGQYLDEDQEIQTGNLIPGSVFGKKPLGFEPNYMYTLNLFV